VERGNKILQKNNICHFAYPEDAVRALSYLNGGKVSTKGGPASGGKGERRKEAGAYSLQLTAKQTGRVEEFLSGKSEVVDTQIAERILKAYKIPVLSSVYIQDIAGARRGVRGFGYPVVIKLIHPELLHKTEVKAVRVDIADNGDLESNLSELTDLASTLKLTDYKIQLQPQVKGALELIVGAKKDPDQYVEVKGKKVLINKGFGHSIVFGMGGIYTEVYKDISLGIAPLSIRDIDRMVEETKVSEILMGARGEKYNVEKVKEVIFNLSCLVTDFLQIAEVDINPLFAKGKEVWVVDVKMIKK
jgi:acyl-CoA synthetase (NDP forming)